ncbi:ring finger domain-containing protein [Cryptosporidium canis]|uniref:Ring finger domain-containing protein n=1 Tax=Cryptosporidium canis TaxID=195482 RepID=A0A9D5DLA4_9CRYT|nr:ring finger domain-containing protein [Cryptosporidium canis]
MEERGIIECSKLYPALCFDIHGGPGFHNVYVGLLIILSGVWMVYRLSKIIEFYEMIRIIQENGRVISIPSLGPYSDELKRLSNAHISQIIRERCSISPTTVKRVHVVSVLEESTLQTKLIPNSSSSSNPDETYSLEVSFKVDSSMPYSVQLLWGVNYLATKKLFGAKKDREKDSKGANIHRNSESRRAALGSSTELYNQIKHRDRLNQSSPDDYRVGYISANESGELATNRELFEGLDMENEGKEMEDLGNPLDFSPSESIKSLAYVNPLLYTSDIANRQPVLASSPVNDFYLDYRGNLSRGWTSNTDSGFPTLIGKIKNRLKESLLKDYIGDSLHYSRWSSSLFGDNANILSKSIKGVLDRILFYDFNLSGHNSNYINGNFGHGRFNITPSSLLSSASASATTELLLETARNGIQSSHYNDKSDKYCISLSRVANHPSIAIDEIKHKKLIEKLSPMYVSEKRYFEKGLSQEFSDKIKLTPEYISSCCLRSPYHDSTDQSQCQENDCSSYFSQAYYEIHDKESDKDGFISRKLFDLCEYEEKTASNKNIAARIPLLILISANSGFIQDENVLNNHVVAIHFDLIQDHYNVPYYIYKPLIVKQVITNSHGQIIEPYDTFGMEDDELDCLICMSNPKDVILLPCRHCISCESCLRSLRQDKCPLCRTTFCGFVVLPIRGS